MTNIFSELDGFDETAILQSQAELALSEGEYDVACSYFFKLAHEKEDSETQQWCHSKIAQCHYQRERWRDCMESAKLSINLTDSRVLLALCLYKKDDDPHSAMTVINEISKLEDLSAFAKEELDSLLPEIRDRAASELSVFPKHVELQVKELKVQGNYKFKSGDFKLAADYYKEGISALEYWRVKLEGNPSYNTNPIIRDQYFNLISILISNLINCYSKTTKMEECRALADKLIEIRPTWKKSHYWSAMTYVASFQFQEARNGFRSCLSCEAADPQEIEQQLQFVDFCERSKDRLSEKILKIRQDLFTAVQKNLEFVASESFATAISRIYTSNETHWRMTCSGLINKVGHITDSSAPKYEASEKDRNLLNEIKRKEKNKIFIHIEMNRDDLKQRVGFSDTASLSENVQEILSLSEIELNSVGQFNSYLSKYFSDHDK